MQDNKSNIKVISTETLSNNWATLNKVKYETGKEFDAIIKFKNLMNKIESPSFEFYENMLDPDFDFSTPIDFEKGMKQLFKHYQFPGNEKGQDLAAIIAYYENLSEQMDMPIKIPEHALVFEGDKFVKEGKLNKALGIFKKMHELYPEGLMGYDRIGDVYFRKEMYKESLKYYLMFLEKQPKNPRILNKVTSIRGEINKKG